LGGAKPAEAPAPVPTPAPAPTASADESPVEPPVSTPAEKPRLQLSWANKKESTETDAAESAAALPKEKPKPISMSRPPIPTAGSEEGVVEDSDLPPPLPVVTESGEPIVDYPAPPGAVPITAAEDDDDEDLAPRKRRKRPEQSPVFKIAIVAIMLLVVGLVVGGAYFAYTTFFGESEEPTPVAATPPPVEPAAAGPQSLAGKLVNKAQNAAAAHDEVTAEVEAVSAPQPKPLPALIMEKEPVQMAPQAAIPSPEFQDWVGEVRINSVREGNPARAFINSILVKQGDVVNPQMGITFRGIDADQNLLIFEDASGAVVGKKY
jgi:hypothetical protein